MDKFRPYDPPQENQRQVGLPAVSGTLQPPGAPNAQAQGVCEVVGHYSAFDVLVNLPADRIGEAELSWLDVCFEIVAQAGPAWYRLDLKKLRDLPLLRADRYQLGADPTPTQGSVEALLFSIRGRQCDRVQVRAYNIAADLPPGFFTIRAWGQDGIYGDRSAVLPVQPFGSITQQLYAAQELTNAAGAEIDFLDNEGGTLRSNPTGGRIDLTRVSISHDEDFAVTYSLTDLAPGDGSPTVRSLFLVHPATSYVEEFTYPLRGRPRAVWSIQATNATDPSLHRINTTAILE